MGGDEEEDEEEETHQKFSQILDPKSSSTKKLIPSYLPLSYISPSPSISTLRPPPSTPETPRPNSTPPLLPSIPPPEFFSSSTSSPRPPRPAIPNRRRSSSTNDLHHLAQAHSRQLSSSSEARARSQYAPTTTVSHLDLTPDESLDLLLKQSTQLLIISNSILSSTIASRAHFSRFFALEDSLNQSVGNAEIGLRRSMEDSERGEDELERLMGGEGIDRGRRLEQSLGLGKEVVAKKEGEDPRELLKTAIGGGGVGKEENGRSKPVRGHTIRVSVDAGKRSSMLSAFDFNEEEPILPGEVDSAAPLHPKQSSATASLLLALSSNSPSTSKPPTHEKSPSSTFSFSFPTYSTSSLPSPTPPLVPTSNSTSNPLESSRSSIDSRRLSSSSILTNTTTLTSPRSSMTSPPPGLYFETILEGDGDIDEAPSPSTSKAPESISETPEEEEAEVTDSMKGKGKRTERVSYSAATTITPLVFAGWNNSAGSPSSSRISGGHGKRRNSHLSNKSQSVVALSSPFLSNEGPSATTSSSYFGASPSPSPAPSPSPPPPSSTTLRESTTCLPPPPSLVESTVELASEYQSFSLSQSSASSSTLILPEVDDSGTKLVDTPHEHISSSYDSPPPIFAGCNCPSPSSSRIIGDNRKRISSILSPKTQSIVALSSSAPSEPSSLVPPAVFPSVSRSRSPSPQPPSTPSAIQQNHHRRTPSTVSLSPAVPPSTPTKRDDAVAVGSHVKQSASAINLVAAAVDKNERGRERVEENVGKEPPPRRGKSWWGWG